MRPPDRGSDSAPQAAPPAAPSGPRLRMMSIAKRFGSTRALEEVELEVRPGEVHALVGQNGAGKSTLMKVLSGAERPDAGRMVLEGRPYVPRGPLEARRAGAAMIYQELSLAPDLTVAENVCLGDEPTRRFGLLDRRAMRRRAAAALARLGRPDIPPEARAGDLGLGARQLVEVARALAGEARIVVMDEPTSSLGRADTEILFGVVRRLRDEGVSVIYISHFLGEVRAVADRFTVLRDGRSVGTGVVAETSTDEIIRRMVGRDLRDVYARVPHDIGEPVLDLAALAGKPLPDGVSLTLRRGEILGIAGLVGAGRTETVRAVFGLAPVARGQVRLAGVDVTGEGAPAMVRRGLGLLSEDRQGEGLAPDLSVSDNLTLSRLAPHTRRGLVSRRRVRDAAQGWINRLGIRTRGPGQAVTALSGGNQQKVALARLLHQDADVLLLDEPTRGIDVGAKADLYRLIGALAARGKAVLWVSSYLPELLGVCDTLAVMTRGRLSPKRPVAAWTPEHVMRVATGETGQTGGEEAA